MAFYSSLRMDFHGNQFTSTIRLPHLRDMVAANCFLLVFHFQFPGLHGSSQRCEELGTLIDDYNETDGKVRVRDVFYQRELCNTSHVTSLS